MTEESAYAPIDCTLHDRLESTATLRTRVDISWETADGARATITDRIVDVFARDGAEFVRLESGVEIRLDRLVTVGGVAYTKD